MIGPMIVWGQNSFSQAPTQPGGIAMYLSRSDNGKRVKLMPGDRIDMVSKGDKWAFLFFRSNLQRSCEIELRCRCPETSMEVPVFGTLKQKEETLLAIAQVIAGLYGHKVDTLFRAGDAEDWHFFARVS